jgi:hypothetical protein
MESDPEKRPHGASLHSTLASAPSAAATGSDTAHTASRRERSVSLMVARAMPMKLGKPSSGPKGRRGAHADGEGGKMATE